MSEAFTNSPTPDLSLIERIQQSKQASAMERAWNVAKSLEVQGANLDALRWIVPETLEGKGISRRIDFSSEFPTDVEYLQPTPLNMTIAIPGEVLFPDQGINVVWSLPLLSRVVKTDYTLPPPVSSELSLFFCKPPLKHTIDVVSFLPFPKKDASLDEIFKPEFYITLDIKQDVHPGDRYGAISYFGGKAVVQLLFEDHPNFLVVRADPLNNVLFSAETLLDKSVDELAGIGDHADTLDIYVYKLTQRPTASISKVFEKYFADIDPGSHNSPDLGKMPDTFGSNLFMGSGSNAGHTLGSVGLGDSSLKYGPTRGSSDTYLSQLPSVPTRRQLEPTEVSKEITPVRLTEGTKREAVETQTIKGYHVDQPYGIQPIRIRFLAVREGLVENAARQLKTITSLYK